MIGSAFPAKFLWRNFNRFVTKLKLQIFQECSMLDLLSILQSELEFLKSDSTLHADTERLTFYLFIFFFKNCTLMDSSTIGANWTRSISLSIMNPSREGGSNSPVRSAIFRCFSQMISASIFESPRLQWRSKNRTSCPVIARALFKNRHSSGEISVNVCALKRKSVNHCEAKHFRRAYAALQFCFFFD